MKLSAIIAIAVIAIVAGLAMVNATPVLNQHALRSLEKAEADAYIKERRAHRRLGQAVEFKTKAYEEAKQAAEATYEEKIDKIAAYEAEAENILKDNKYNANAYWIKIKAEIAKKVAKKRVL
jgi:exoribonuclease R